MATTKEAQAALDKLEALTGAIMATTREAQTALDKLEALEVFAGIRTQSSLEAKSHKTKCKDGGTCHHYCETNGKKTLF